MHGSLGSFESFLVETVINDKGMKEYILEVKADIEADRVEWAGGYSDGL